MDTDKLVKYLKEEKKASDNTVQAYLRDVKHFSEYVYGRGVYAIENATNTDVVGYVMKLKEDGKTKATINRKLASIRMVYNYLIKEGSIKTNPAEDIKTPRIEKKTIEFLSVEEMNSLFEVKDESEKGIRNMAILELLYATGIRATELIDLKLSDCNLRMGFIKCDGEHSKARIIPMGRPCRNAMEKYVYDIRPVLLKDHDCDNLFINYMGGTLTRQGLWKILKELGESAGLERSLTPQMIRNSFAVHMLQNGADVKSLQELMGHEDIAATQAYLAVTKNRIKDVYDKSHPRA